MREGSVCVWCGATFLSQKGSENHFRQSSHCQALSYESGGAVPSQQLVVAPPSEDAGPDHDVWDTTSEEYVPPFEVEHTDPNIKVETSALPRQVGGTPDDNGYEVANRSDDEVFKNRWAVRMGEARADEAEEDETRAAHAEGEETELEGNTEHAAGGGEHISGNNLVAAGALLPQQLWHDKVEGRAHIWAGCRISPFWTGDNELENDDFLEQMERSMSLSEHKERGHKMLPAGWTELMRKAVRKTVKARLTGIINHLRAQYRLVYGNNSNFTDPPTLDDMLKLSKNPTAYAFYIQNFLGYVVQPKLFANSLRQNPKLLSSRVDSMAKTVAGARGMFEEFVTIAEETLGLFIMANYQDVWEAQIRLKRTDVDDTPKYTRARNKVVLKQKQENGVNVTTSELISREGTTYYNTLFNRVKRDRRRKHRKQWEENLLKEMSTKQAGKGKRKIREITPTRPPLATVRVVPNWRRNQADDDYQSDSDDTIESDDE